MKFKMKLVAASVALVIGAGQAQAEEKMFVEDHPWLTTAGGVALMAVTSGIPQIFGVIFTIGGLSHAFKPEITSLANTMEKAQSDHAPKESETPLCTGEIFKPADDYLLADKIIWLPKQKRAEAIAQQLRIGCENGVGADAGRAGNFSMDWDEMQEVMHTTCSFSPSNNREHFISFQGDFAKWRTMGANCAHPVKHEEEAELKKKFGPSSLD